MENVALDEKFVSEGCSDECYKKLECRIVNMFMQLNVRHQGHKASAYSASSIPMQSSAA